MLPEDLFETILRHAFECKINAYDCVHVLILYCTRMQLRETVYILKKTYASLQNFASVRVVLPHQSKVLQVRSMKDLMFFTDQIVRELRMEILDATFERMRIFFNQISTPIAYPGIPQEYITYVQLFCKTFHSPPLEPPLESLEPLPAPGSHWYNPMVDSFECTISQVDHQFDIDGCRYFAFTNTLYDRKTDIGKAACVFRLDLYGDNLLVFIFRYKSDMRRWISLTKRNFMFRSNTTGNGFIADRYAAKIFRDKFLPARDILS